MTIQSNLLGIKNQIALYEKKYEREPGSVKLLGASKGQSIQKIEEAYQAGLRSLGENYLQEALIKMDALSDKEIEWHFIGTIQTNKTRKIAEQFSWVQSVDNVHIAKRLNDQRPPHLPPLNICIEIISVRKQPKLALIFPYSCRLSNNVVHYRVLNCVVSWQSLHHTLPLA